MAGATARLLRILVPVNLHGWLQQKEPVNEPGAADGSAWPPADDDHVTEADVENDFDAPATDILATERYERRRTMTLRLVRLGYAPNTTDSIAALLTEDAVRKFTQDYVPNYAAVVGEQWEFVPTTAYREMQLYNAISDVYANLFRS